jgi:hypothetical protein
VRSARDGMARLDRERLNMNLPPLPFGVGLHLGPVVYGNIGAPDADKESHWLPAPDGPIYLVMRPYWLLAKDNSTLDLASRRRHVDTAGGEEGQLNRAARWEGVFPLKLPSGPLRAPVRSMNAKCERTSVDPAESSPDRFCRVPPISATRSRSPGPCVDRKSRAHAWISIDSPKNPKTE